MESARSLALLLCYWLQGCARMDLPAKRSHHADKVRSGVPQRAPPGNDARRHALSPAAVCVCCCNHVRSRGQILCPGCHQWKKKRSSGNKSCWPCEKYMQLHGHWPGDAPAVAASPPPPLFERDAATHSHLSVERRWAITLLHKMKRDDAAIAKEVDCDVRSVRH